MAEPLPRFQALQYAFAAHIRDPQNNPPPTDVEDRRMKIYRELFFNNVQDFLASSFPVLRRITPNERWQALAQDYFSNHQAHSPYFLDIPKEFLTYLEHEREAQPQDPPFLQELAHYEWVELALSVLDEDPDYSQLNRDGDLLEEHPVVSPLAWALSYRFPVHRIGPDFLPDAPGESPTHLLVYRNRDDQIGFFELNPVSARLADLLLDPSNLSGRAALEQIAVELQHPDPQKIISFGLELIQDWYRHDIILGTR